MIEKTLTLSTLHVPPAPSLGSVRVANHRYGWIVFVAQDSDVPNWLAPIYKMAQENKCSLINFDADAQQVPSLETHDW